MLGASAPPEQLAWSAAQAAELVCELRMDIEFAGSPLATINHLGPAVVVSDFGNNAGLLLGPVIADWRTHSFDSLNCETFVAGDLVGRGGAASISGGLLQSLGFALRGSAGMRQASALRGAQPN